MLLYREQSDKATDAMCFSSELLNLLGKLQILQAVADVRKKYIITIKARETELPSVFAESHECRCRWLMK